MTVCFRLLLRDRPGALARITDVFVRGGRSIRSLSAGPGRGDRSWVTITAALEPGTVALMKGQLARLLDVLEVATVDPPGSELALLRIRPLGDDRARIVEAAAVFRARLVRATADSLTFEATGASEEIEALAEILSELGSVELARTGPVALGPATLGGRSGD